MENPPVLLSTLPTRDEYFGCVSAEVNPPDWAWAGIEAAQNTSAAPIMTNDRMRLVCRSIELSMSAGPYCVSGMMVKPFSGSTITRIAPRFFEPVIV